MYKNKWIPTGSIRLDYINLTRILAEDIDELNSPAVRAWCRINNDKLDVIAKINEEIEYERKERRKDSHR